MTIHAFNTGRGYTPQGQRIAWQIVKVAIGEIDVAFVDADRQIDGVVTLEGLEPTNQRVLAAYDHGDYKPFRFTPRDAGLYDSLLEAANGLQPPEPGEAAYEEGKRAYRNGQPFWRNPNQEGSDDAKQWSLGYDSEAAEEYGRTP